MQPLLATLRKTPQVTPQKFLEAHPGSWIQYYDDTPAKDASKALSARRFDVETARRKQQERCAVCFSLQMFGETRTKEGLLLFRSLGVDVDLFSAGERRGLSDAEIDRRKNEYLERRLLPFPLKPHWLIETRHGFHAIFRVKPERDAEGIRVAVALNLRLVRALGGDENAALLTQVLRVPGTLQFKDPQKPFLCRLLLDNASAIDPYDLDAVRTALDTREVFRGAGTTERAQQRPASAGETSAGQAPDCLAGVREGQRNATAASIVGGILGRLPEYLWETAGWGGMKEWNQKNQPPLSERELRTVFESIARRERTKRQGHGGEVMAGGRGNIHIWVEVRVRSLDGEEGRPAGADGPRPRPVPAHPR